jgi:flagellar motor switch protein FliN/FliY
MEQAQLNGKQAMTDANNPSNLEATIDQATQAVAVSLAATPRLEQAPLQGEAMGVDGLMSVPVGVRVELGRARMTISELMKLTPGALIELDRQAHQPVDVLVGGKLVARGEVVTIGEQYGVRITSVVNGT